MLGWSSQKFLRKLKSVGIWFALSYKTKIKTDCDTTNPVLHCDFSEYNASVERKGWASVFVLSSHVFSVMVPVQMSKLGKQV